MLARAVTSVGAVAPSRPSGSLAETVTIPSTAAHVSLAADARAGARLTAPRRTPTAALVPDQLKSGVTRPCLYEPEAQRTYEELAEH